MRISFQLTEQKLPFTLKLISLFIFLIVASAVAVFATTHRTFAADSCTPPATTYGSDTVSVNVPQTGTYTIWSRIMLPVSTSNTYLLNIDGTSCFNVGGNNSLSTNTWTWLNYADDNTGTPIQVTLNQGSHTFQLIGTAPNLEIDRLEALTDGTCTPTGTGDNCASDQPIITINGAPTGDVSLVGDVDGDGKADAVLVNTSTGNVWAGISTGHNFTTPVAWSANPIMAHANRYFLADVDGDGKADLVAYFANTGDWYVAKSSGSGFWPPTQWAAVEGMNASNVFLADVDGDGKADIVSFYGSTGNWYVDLSSGSGFWGPPTLWIVGDGFGSSNQAVGDFNGDHKADAAVYFASEGSWYISLSNGSAFGYPGHWAYGQGLGSQYQMMADVDGDHRADIVYFYPNGSWYVSPSSGSGFWAPTAWAFGEGSGGTTQMLGDVTGDGKADVVTYWGNVPGIAAGTWSVDSSSGGGFYGPPNQWTNGFGGM